MKYTERDEPTRLEGWTVGWMARSRGMAMDGSIVFNNETTIRSAPGPPPPPPPQPHHHHYSVQLTDALDTIPPWNE